MNEEEKEAPPHHVYLSCGAQCDICGTHRMSPFECFWPTKFPEAWDDPQHEPEKYYREMLARKAIAYLVEQGEIDGAPFGLWSEIDE